MRLDRAAPILAALLLVAQANPAVEPTPQQQVETRLMCYCGCADLTVRVCTCGTADAIRAEISDRLAAGQTPDQIVATYVERRGEQIRSAPTKTGFNLVAWITPFAALLIAGTCLVFLVRRWAPARSKAAGTAADGPVGGRPLTPEERKVLERIEREIRDTL
jgi:cytochrome c-type biogenesis protein CcmH